jgi:hypothetical protein
LTLIQFQAWICLSDRCKGQEAPGETDLNHSNSEKFCGRR